MKKALSQVIQQETADGRYFKASIVQKESDLGLTFNQRLLILVEGAFFGYISKYVETEDPSKIDLSKCKESIPTKHITAVDRAKDTICIKFYIVEKTTNKKISKKYVLKFSTEKLAITWADLFNQEKTKSEAKRSMSASRRNNSHLSPPPSQSNSKMKSKSELKSEIPKNNPDRTKPQKPLQFSNNPLYNSKEEEEDASNQQNPFILPPASKPPPINRKLEFEPVREEPAAESEEGKSDSPELKQKVTQEQIKREQQLRERQRKILLQQKEQERILRQKQQLEQEKIRLEEQRRKIEAEKKKIEQDRKRKEQLERKKPESASVSYERESGKETIREDFFNVQAQSPIKRESKLKNIQKSKEPTRPKIDGMDYFGLVNKLIANNKPGETQQQKRAKMEVAHEMLFQMEKKKFIEREQTSGRKSEASLKVLPKELGWTYKYILAQHEGTESALVDEFVQHCEELLVQVVGDLHLPDRKKKFRPKYIQESFYTYEQADLEFKVALVGLKEIYNQNEPGERDRISDNLSIKILLNQIRTYQILHQAIRQLEFGGTKMALRVPLTCLCEYQGCVAFFKANSEFDKLGFANNSSVSERKLDSQLESLSELTQVSLQIFKDKGNCFMPRLNQNYYRELAAETGASHINFDFFMIQEIKILMPPDVLYQKRNKFVSTVLQSSQNGHYLRQELLTGYLDPSQKIVSTILSSLKKTNPNLRSPQAKNKLKNEGELKLEQLSQNIITPITAVIKELNDLTEFYRGPQQFSDYLHERGINIRYLGLIYEHVSLIFTANCILADIAARCCKNLFRKTIQDVHIDKDTAEQETSPLRFEANIHEKIIDFFNCILGNNIDATTIWGLLSTHSLNYFNVSLNSDKIQTGVFLISLVHHCGLIVDWGRISGEAIFATNEFFNEENLLGVKVRSKAYEPMLSRKEEVLLEQIQRNDPEAFATLCSRHALESEALPEGLKYSKVYPTVRRYLSNFIPPENINSRGSFQHLQIYNYQGFPNQSDIEVQMMELKWNLNHNRREHYLAIITSLMNRISSYYGDFHPYLSELYEMFAMFHRDNGELEDSIAFSKSSLVNMLQICGANHSRVGESYYQLALCCIKAGRTEKAILNLEKAKSIFEMNEKTEGIPYAFVLVKLGLLFLSEGKLKQSENITKFSLEIFKRESTKSSNLSPGPSFEEEKIEACEILARIYEISQNKEQVLALGRTCEQELPSIKSSTSLEKALKIVLYPRLSSLASSEATSYLNIISLLSLEASTETYIKGFQRLKQRVDENSLLENISSYLQNILTIQKYIGENGTLKSWKSFSKVYERETVNDFISLTEELSYFLGEGFLSGSLRENL